ncbi:MAG TPA: hypothetical protein PKD61_23425, partial [Polyangiaceae bacterium]|nr:hypothetical protein [Polyangiaceae bacterium]
TGQADVHCSDLPNSCTCLADPSHLQDDSQSSPRCVPPDGRGTTCCQSPTYPNAGTCECKNVGCKMYGAGCGCGPLESDGPLNACDASTPYCCLTATGSCSCTTVDIGCPGGQVVATCDVHRATACAPGMVPAASCKGDPSTGTGGFAGSGGVGATGGGGAGAPGGNGGNPACSVPQFGKACTEAFPPNGDPCTSCITNLCCSHIEHCLADNDCGGLMDCWATKYDSCKSVPVGGAAEEACWKQACPTCFTPESWEKFDNVTFCLTDAANNLCQSCK